VVLACCADKSVRSRVALYQRGAILIGSSATAVAAPYTFTPSDYIEYGIYFSPRGSLRPPNPKLLTIRFGDIERYYAEYFPQVKEVPTRKQQLRLSTPRGSIWINRNDNEGLTVVRDTYRSRGRGGTKLLDVHFEGAQCRDAAGTVSTCSVTLLLTTEGPDRGVSRRSRTLQITSSTGLSFRYKSVGYDGGKPLNLPLLNRTPVISNYAWEWRPGDAE
jgi:hypothetical protein